MINKKWIDWNDSCPNCGDDVRVLTAALQDEKYPQAYDSDIAKCNSCKWEGSINVDEDNGTAWLDDGNLDELEREQ